MLTENRDFFILPGHRRSIAIPFGTEILEWCDYPMVKKLAIRRWKKFDDTFSRLARILACDRQTDRRTDRRTDILRLHSPRYAYCVASRGKTGVEIDGSDIVEVVRILPSIFVISETLV